MIKDIYFINTAEIARKLADKSVSDYLALKHFIAFLMIFNAAYVFPFFTVPPQENAGVMLFLTFITMAVVNCYGLIWIFQINRKGDNSEFFKRFCCLSLSVSIRVTIVLSIVFIILLLLLSHFNSSIPVEILMYLIEIGYLLYFYKIMGASIRAASNHT